MRANEFVNEGPAWDNFKTGFKKGFKKVAGSFDAQKHALKNAFGELVAELSDLPNPSPKQVARLASKVARSYGVSPKKLHSLWDKQHQIRMAESAIEERKTDPKICRSPKRLGRSDHSSCVSQGLRPHQSKGKGHTDGKGHYLKGKKAKSVKYGGAVPDYS